MRGLCFFPVGIGASEGIGRVFDGLAGAADGFARFCCCFASVPDSSVRSSGACDGLARFADAADSLSFSLELLLTHRCAYFYHEMVILAVVLQVLAVVLQVLDRLYVGLVLVCYDSDSMVVSD